MKIIQIIPADGNRKVITSLKGEDRVYATYEVVCWALMDNDTVVGMVRVEDGEGHSIIPATSLEGVSILYS